MPKYKKGRKKKLQFESLTNVSRSDILSAKYMVAMVDEDGEVFLEFFRTKNDANDAADDVDDSSSAEEVVRVVELVSAG